MKTTLFIVAMALMATIALSPLHAQSDTKIVRNETVSDFSSIEMQSVGEINFTQSKKCSFRIEGPEKHVQQVTVTVKDRKLIIGHKEKNNNSKKVKFYISAPSLNLVKVSGVGAFNCSQPLKVADLKLLMNGVGSIDIADLQCKKLQVELDGVGNVNIHVNCDELNANADGVGHVTLSGSTGVARITRDGVGGMNTRNLKIGK